MKKVLLISLLTLTGFVPWGHAQGQQENFRVAISPRAGVTRGIRLQERMQTEIVISVEGATPGPVNLFIRQVGRRRANGSMVQLLGGFPESLIVSSPSFVVLRTFGRSLPSDSVGVELGTFSVIARASDGRITGATRSITILRAARDRQRPFGEILSPLSGESVDASVLEELAVSVFASDLGFLGVSAVDLYLDNRFFGQATRTEGGLYVFKVPLEEVKSGVHMLHCFVYDSFSNVTLVPLTFFVVYRSAAVEGSELRSFRLPEVIVIDAENDGEGFHRSAMHFQ